MTETLTTNGGLFKWFTLLEGGHCVAVRRGEADSRRFAGSYPSKGELG